MSLTLAKQKSWDIPLLKHGLSSHPQSDNPRIQITPEQQTPTEVIMMDNEIMRHAIEVRTTIRQWQEQIRQHMKQPNWQIPPQTDNILFLTIYRDSLEKNNDDFIAHELHMSLYDVKYQRCKAVLVLLEEYKNVLYGWLNQNAKVMQPILQSVDQKIKRLQEFCKSLEQGSLDEELDMILDSDFISGRVGKIISSYLDLRSDFYAEMSNEFKSVAELSHISGYSQNRVRALIREGLVIGAQSDKGWFGSQASLMNYQFQQRPSKVGAPRHPRK